MSKQKDYIPKKAKSRLRLFIIMSFLSLGLGLASHHIYNKHDSTSAEGKKVQSEFYKKENALKKQITYTKELIKTHKKQAALLKDLKFFNQTYLQEGYGLCVFKDNVPIYWTDSQICDEEILSSSSKTTRATIELPYSVDYLIRDSLSNNIKIYGLIQISQNFEIENNYLQGGPSLHLNLSENFELHYKDIDNSFPIFDSNNNFVFSIKCDSIKSANKAWGQLTLILLSIFFFSLVAIIGILAWMNRNFFYLNIPILCLFMFGVYKIFQSPLLKNSLIYKDLILDYKFSTENIPSMNILYIYTAVLSFAVLTFSVDIKRLLLALPKKMSLLVGIIFLTFSATYTTLLGSAISTIVNNASFSMAFHKILDVNLASVLGILCIGTLSLNTFRASRVVTTALCRRNKHCDIFILIFTFTVIIAFLKIVRFNDISVYSIVFFLCSNGLFVILKPGFIYRYRLTYITIHALIISLYITLELSSAIEEREWKLMDLKSVTLDDSRNLDIELRLQDIGCELASDTTITRLFNQNSHISSFDYIYEHIKRHYLKMTFSGYDIRMAAEVNKLPYKDNNRNTETSALNFLINTKGKRIGESSFYFLGHNEGLNSYIGRFNYSLKNGTQATLLVSIHKKTFLNGQESNLILYPGRGKESPLTKHFSYAKYYNKTLVHQEGTFAYSRGMFNMPSTIGESLMLQTRGYKHLISKLSDHSHIIVSAPYTSVSNYFTSFGYIFIIILCFSIVMTWLFNSDTPKMWQYKFSIRTKIQVSVIAVNLIAIMLLSFITISGNITKNVELKKEELNRNAKTVFDYLNNIINDDSLEEHKLDAIKKELPRLSDIIWNLIVLYDTEGRIIMTTNPEIDRLGIVGKVMDIDAFYNFKVNSLFKYANDSHISSVRYHAIYQSIITQSNKHIGYLCVPYITITKEDTRILSNTFIALINMFVLVFVLSVIASVLISNQITLPLTMLRNNLMSIKLEKGNKKLTYNSSDEIGSLVDEYNLSLDKIEEKSKLLARTERELAWREMAKQIAHEIKNPLTPIKLNIQFLQNAINGDPDKFKALFGKMSATIIDQIDELAKISTEFSAFANIPSEITSKFDLNNKLVEICNLFSTGQNSFQIKYIGKEIPVYIEADAGQISRAFTNVIKNATQACDGSSDAKVEVELFTNKDNAIVSIRDNGDGIPKEIYDKLFVPNFTTKSSGMGIGLSIAYNIVKTFKGDISFTSELGRGTTFIVTLPLYNSYK